MQREEQQGNRKNNKQEQQDNRKNNKQEQQDNSKNMVTARTRQRQEQ